VRASLFASTLVSLLALGPALPASGAPSAASLLERARAQQAALEARPARQKLRHHVEAVAEAFARARKVATGAAKVEALTGELEATRLLARWSGLARDKQRAALLEKQLAEARGALARSSSKKNPKEPEPRAPAPTLAKGQRRWLSDIRLEGSARELRLVLEANGEVEAKKTILGGKKGRRVVLDLSPLAASRAALGPVPNKGGAVKAARVVQLDKDTVRLMIDVADARAAERVQLVEGLVVALGPKAAATARALAAARRAAQPRAVEPSEASAAEAPSEAPDEADDAEVAKTQAPAGVVEALVAQLLGEAPKAEPAPEAAVESAPAAKAPAREPASEDEPADAPSMIADDAGSEATAGSAALVRIRRVVIDAGHGGKDVGAIGVGGVREKDVNLAVALELGEQLKAQLGVEVIFTRARDEFLSLPERSAIANRAGADLFISVHSNAHRKKSVSGMETYYLNVTSDRYATRLAHRENTLDHQDLDAPEPTAGMSEASAEKLLAGALGQDLRLVLADLAMRSATVESKKLARYVQESAVRNLRREHPDLEDLGVKHALFYVLLGTRMPSILVETGFLTHPDEGRRLGGAAYQKRLAKGLAAGVARFVEERAALAQRIGREESSLGNLRHVRAAP
jgi:N-acetylmuramoyl-L-alanine amidase